MTKAAVIAAANSKGGCGKSTTILILAGEYCAQGLRVHIIDADPKKRLVRWGQAGAKPDGVTVGEASAANMRDEIEKARGRADVVLIDVEGTANAALTLAVAYSNLVIVPATISPPDVEDELLVPLRGVVVKGEDLPVPLRDHPRLLARHRGELERLVELLLGIGLSHDVWIGRLRGALHLRGRPRFPFLEPVRLANRLLLLRCGRLRAGDG